MLESLHQIGGVTGCFVLKLVLGPQLACPKKRDPKRRQEIDTGCWGPGHESHLFELVGAAFDKSMKNENHHLLERETKTGWKQTHRFCQPLGGFWGGFLFVLCPSRHLRHLINGDP